MRHHNSIKRYTFTVRVIQSTISGVVFGRMAELVDAHGSGPCVRKNMEVRVFLRPQVSVTNEDAGRFQSGQDSKLLRDSFRSTDRWGRKISATGTEPVRFESSCAHKRDEEDYESLLA